MSTEKLLYKLSLNFIQGIGPVNAKKLIAYTGGVEALFKEKVNTLAKIPGFKDSVKVFSDKSIFLKKAEKELEYINNNKIKLTFYLDDDFPHRLNNCYDSPLMLFSKGKVNFNKKKVISIVGTRNITDYGKTICNKLIKDLEKQNHDFIIVSGLAYGVDVCSHKAALENNIETIAVLGTGLNIIYPAVHKNISNDIINKGALVTEFTSQSKNDRSNFAKRNRIVAGISDATIVVESAKKGGSLITADIANSYNRDVFAFPGRIDDKYSEGCNRLIKSNKAVVIEDYKDLEYILGWETETAAQKQGIQKELFVELTEKEKIIINYLKSGNNNTIDRISIGVKMPTSKVLVELLNLEFKGIIKPLPGNVYKLN